MSAIKQQRELKKLLRVVDNFKGRKICVVGDLMLDRFIYGDTERISPEAPVPVVTIEKEVSTLGGAGNLASNIAALDGHILLAGSVGDDRTAEELLQELRDRNIDVSGVVKDRNKPTTEKIRLMSRGQQVVRIDKESLDCIDKKIEKQVINFLSSNIKDCEAIVISDYAKGFITKSLVRAMVNISKKYRIPVIADTKPEHILYFKNVHLITPNYKEASIMARSNDVRSAGSILQKMLRCNVLITRGSEGMTIFEGNRTENLPAQAKEVFDVMGAGDTVAGLVTLSLASGASLREAAIIANHAAGIVVGKSGAAVTSLKELKRELISNAEKNKETGENYYA